MMNEKPKSQGYMILPNSLPKIVWPKKSFMVNSINNNEKYNKAHQRFPKEMPVHTKANIKIKNGLYV
jgi:hypothetical protein